MKLPFFSLCLLVCAVLYPVASAQEAKAEPDWKIEVVPSRYSVNKGAVLYATKPLDRFYIILHNVSGKDQKVWRDWCTWGYENMTLLAELADGGKVELKKVAKSWDKNYPDASLVPAGRSFVFEVHLAGKTWQGADKLPKDPFMLTVRYLVPKSAEATEKKVWTGSVQSEPIKVTLRQ